MAIKIGEEVAKARKRQGYSQEQLTLDLPIERTTLAMYETGDRRLPKDMKPIIAQKIDDVELYFMMWQEATGDVSLPFMNGEFVDQHPSSMVFMVQRQSDEAVEQLRNLCWSKPVQNWDETEKEELKRVIFHILDAAAGMVSLVAVLCRAHQISMRNLFREWRLTLKARRLTK